MKILIVYYSKTGNTKQIAKMIHSATSVKHDSSLIPLKAFSIEKLHDCDLLFVGAPCHSSDLAKPMLKFLSLLPDMSSFKLAGFYTHSTTLPMGSERTEQLFNDWAGKCHKSFEKAEEDKKIDFLGDFHCQGKAGFLVECFIHSKIIKDKKEWKESKKEIRLHPTEEDMNNAKQFAKKVLDSI